MKVHSGYQQKFRLILSVNKANKGKVCVLVNMRSTAAETIWSRSIKHDKLACSYIGLHAVTCACMQLDKLACTSMSLHAVI